MGSPDPDALCPREYWGLPECTCGQCTARLPRCDPDPYGYRYDQRKPETFTTRPDWDFDL